MTTTPAVPQAFSKLVLATACALASFAACGQEALNENTILGSWARDASECARPELKFEPKKVTHSTDGDGTPVRFVYKNVDYKLADGIVTVSLHDVHAFAQTQDDRALQFKLINANQIDLQRKKFGAETFVRCKR